MKRVLMGFAGIMMAISLVACTPTQVTETAPHVAGGSNPQGLTPEMVKENQQTVEKLPDPDAPVLEMVFVYSLNDAKTKLVREVVDLEVLSEETLMASLIERNVLDEGVEAIAFGIEGGEKAGPGVESGSAESDERIGTLDLSKTIDADAAEEQLILNAVANTFIENYELDKLRILVDGENYASANITYGDEDYLTFTDDYEEKAN